MTPLPPAHAIRFWFFRSLPFLFIFLFPAAAPSQESLDSADSLTSAKYATYMRIESGLFNDALLSAKAALKTAENRYGPTHLSVVPILTDLATLYRVMGRYEEAQTTLKWGLAIQENKLGPEDSRVGESLNHLASLYDDWGRWEEADFFGKRALAILEKKGTRNNLIEALSRLGGIELNLQKNLEAQNLLKRALALQEKIGGSPARTIILLSALSKAYTAGKRPADAESSLQKALTLSQKSFPPDSVEIADATERLADFYSSTSQPERAKPLYESALHTYKSYVGVYYGYTILPYLQRLANAYQTAGEYAKAKDLLEKALATTKESFGPDHPLVAITLIRLAHAEEKMGEKKASKARGQESLAILKSHFAGDYPLIREVEAQLGK